MLLKVTAAACIDNKGRIWSVPKPARHHDVLKYMTANGASIVAAKQGFKLSDGSYTDRLGAYHVADRAGQLIPRPENGYSGKELFSEDVW